MKRKAEIEELITEAIRRCEEYYHDRREWSRRKLVHPGWVDGSQDLEIIARIGSPAKCYIIVNYGTGRVMAFGTDDKIFWQDRTERER